MRILVTGGTGFIGGQVLRELAQSAHQVRCLVRPTSKRPAEAAGAELVVGDVTDRESLRRAVSGCDAVIHAAAIYDFWPKHTSDYWAVNVEGTRNVMEAALAAGVRKVVHVSSVVVYEGCAEERPNEESEPGTPSASRYSRSKADAERVAWELFRARGLPLVVVYPGGVTGPGDPKPSGRYIETLVRGRMPAQVLVNTPFPWVHVRDVARVIVRALEKDGNVGERYFAAAELLTFGEFNRLISEAAGVRIPRLVMPNFILMPSAALLSLFGRIFGFAPILGMSLDQIRTMKRAVPIDGSKAERELGIRYERVADAVAEAVASIGPARVSAGIETQFARRRT